MGEFEMACNLVMAEMRQLRVRHDQADKEGWYFDGRNRDMWMDDFIEQLRQRYQQPERIASND